MSTTIDCAAPAHALQASYWRERLAGWLALICCTSAWADMCRDEVEAGRVGWAKRKPDQARVLHNRGVYPPGGGATRMVECSCCDRYAPPGREIRDREVVKLPDGQVRVEYSAPKPLCLDCYYASLDPITLAHLPGAIKATRTFSRRELLEHMDGRSFSTAARVRRRTEKREDVKRDSEWRGRRGRGVRAEPRWMLVDEKTGQWGWAA